MPIKRIIEVFRISLLILVSMGALQQSKSDYAFTDHLGFSLMPGANSTPVSFKIVRIYDNKSMAPVVQNISRDEFLRIATGAQSSTANLKGENLFIKNEITDCSFGRDTVINHMLYKASWQCSIVDELWKLRYGEYPFAVEGNKVSIVDPTAPKVNAGWARNPNAPSEGQLQMLRPYGAVFIIDLIYGDNAFRLLHDMQDVAWQSRYRGS